MPLNIVRKNYDFFELDSKRSQLNQELKGFLEIAQFYKESLEHAKKNATKDIELPLLLEGISQEKALELAINCVSDFLKHTEMTITLAVPVSFQISKSEERYKHVESYIKAQFVEEMLFHESQQIYEAPKNMEIRHSKSNKLEDALSELDESFSQMLLRLIEEKELKDPEVYKKANITKQTFSKIRNKKQYQPTKETAIAFAIALELNLDETKDLLLKAGYALSKSSRFDLIIRYFIESYHYDIFEINEVLFAYEERLLGSL